TDPAAGRHGCHHEAICYDSDEELLAVAVPFLTDGIAADEPTVLSLGERRAALVRSALPAGVEVSLATGGVMYTGPASAIRSYQQLLAGYRASGARRVRIVGELPPAHFGSTWDWWARYESAVNHALDEFPVWCLCTYDRRLAPAAVLADVGRTHPWIATADGRREPSPHYTDPLLFLRENRPGPPDPVQLTAPALELTDPSPARARHGVREVDRGLLPADDVDDLVVAVSETVTNAHRYGCPPVRVRYWTADDRIVVTVSDCGEGPKDPFAGLLPTRDGAEGGLGLWITFQSCSHVTMSRDAGSYTLRLTAGNPPAGDILGAVGRKP
ncbi:anti-sigma factor RsbA family regulatory protein, partial [Micromonospora zhanjiangensis]